MKRVGFGCIIIIIQDIRYTKRYYNSKFQQWTWQKNFLLIYCLQILHFSFLSTHIYRPFYLQSVTFFHTLQVFFYFYRYLATSPFLYIFSLHIRYTSCWEASPNIKLSYSNVKDTDKKIDNVEVELMLPWKCYYLYKTSLCHRCRRRHV